MAAHSNQARWSCVITGPSQSWKCKFTLTLTYWRVRTVQASLKAGIA